MDGPLLWCFHSAQKLWFAHALVVVHHARVVVDVAVSEKKYKNFNFNLGIWICMPQTCSTNEWFVIKVMAQIIALLSGHSLILILGDINCCYMGYHLERTYIHIFWLKSEHDGSVFEWLKEFDGRMVHHSRHKSCNPWSKNELLIHYSYDDLNNEEKLGIKKLWLQFFLSILKFANQMFPLFESWVMGSPLYVSNNK